MIGDSMSPFIQDGDGVVVEHSTADIEVGDVILYPKPAGQSLRLCSGQSPGFVVHRVVRVIGDGPKPLFVTRGDNRSLSDPPIGRGQVLGKVAEVERAEGRSPEDRLLLCCARTEVDEGTIKKVWELLHGELDWAYLLTAAIRHAIPQLLYYSLKAIGAEGAPPGVLARMEQMYYANALRYLRFSRALEEVLGAFKEIGIEAIVLKGMALATQVYPVAALRQCGDIDVLVREEDLLRAEEVLLGLGYTVPGPGLPNEWFGQCHRHLPYLKDAGRIKLEVHWVIVSQPNPFCLPVSELWPRAQPLRIGGSETWALGPADLLLHLSVHAVPSPDLLWGQDIDLRHLCDIAETIRVYPMDWDQLIVRARHYDVTRCLYVTLRLARRMLQADVPHDVLEALQPTDLDPRWLASLEERVLKRRLGSTKVPHRLVRLLSAQGVFNKLRVLRQILFPAPSAIAQAHGVSWTSRKLYWYYVTRPFRLLARRGGFLLRFLIRERGECSLQ